MTTIAYVGMGVGAVAAAALYLYFKKRVRDNGFASPQDISDEKSDTEEESDIEIVDQLGYETLLKWLKTQYKSGNVIPGDSFVIIQSPKASEAFKEAMPHKKSLLQEYKCIGALVLRDKDATCSKFFLYKTLLPSMVEILPKDEDTAYVQNIS